MAPSAGADGERTAARAEDGSASCPAAGPVPDSDSLRPESQHASPGEEKGDTVGPRAQPVKRKKKDKTAALLSFGDELEEDGDGSAEFGSISQSTTKRQGFLQALRCRPCLPASCAAGRVGVEGIADKQRQGVC